MVGGMRIVFQPMPPDPAGDVVGTLDGAPLVYVGRVPTVADVRYTHEEIGEAYLDALEVLAAKVLGGDWSRPLATVTGLNQRTTARDRIAKSGLPTWVIFMLIEAASHEHPRALGDLLCAVARLRGLTDLRYGMGAAAAHARQSHAALDVALRLHEWGHARRLAHAVHTGSKDPGTDP
jgi:hypothetical protein